MASYKNKKCELLLSTSYTKCWWTKYILSKSRLLSTSTFFRTSVGDSVRIKIIGKKFLSYHKVWRPDSGAGVLLEFHHMVKNLDGRLSWGQNYDDHKDSSQIARERTISFSFLTWHWKSPNMPSWSDPTGFEFLSPALSCSDTDSFNI